jgi:hypothetical protein
VVAIGPGRAAEAEATATITAIARLRWRISQPGTLEHPAVMRELGKLEEQLIALLDSRPGRRPGRHRSPARTLELVTCADPGPTADVEC